MMRRLVADLRQWLSQTVTEDADRRWAEPDDLVDRAERFHRAAKDLRRVGMQADDDVVRRRVLRWSEVLRSEGESLHGRAAWLKQQRGPARRVA